MINFFFLLFFSYTYHLKKKVIIKDIKWIIDFLSIKNEFKFTLIIY